MGLRAAVGALNLAVLVLVSSCAVVLAVRLRGLNTNSAGAAELYGHCGAVWDTAFNTAGRVTRGWHAAWGA